MKHITGIILAGGLSSRMGQDKGLIHYKGRALVEYSIDVLKPLCSEIIISSNNQEYNKFGFRVVSDVHKKIGPIGGIYSALSQSKTDDTILCPCDMPFVNSELFEKVLSNRGNSAVAIVQSTTKNVYPTLGYYNTSCLPTILKQIEHQQFKLQLLIKELKAINILINDTKSLLNINFPEDLV